MPKRTSSCRGDRSLLTMGVNLWNAYLIGEEVTESSCLPGNLAAALKPSYVPKSYSLAVIGAFAEGRLSKPSIGWPPY